MVKEYLGRGKESVTFSGSVVERVLGALYFLREDGRKVALAREVLAHQAVEVLIASSLPGSVGVGHVHRGLQGQFDEVAVRELAPPVAGQGVDVGAPGHQTCRHRIGHIFGLARGAPSQAQQAAEPLVHRHQHATSLAGAHRIHFPMPELAHVLDGVRAFADRGAVGKALGPMTTIATPPLGQAQAMAQAVPVEVTVDGGVAGHGDPQQLTTALNLHRTPPLAHPLLNLGEGFGRQLGTRAGLVTAGLGRLVCRRGAIGPLARVAPSLPADGAGVAAKLSGDGDIGESCTQQGGDLVAFFLGQVSIGHGSFAWSWSGQPTAPGPPRFKEIALQG